MVVDRLRENAAVMCIVVLEANEPQDRRTNVGVICEGTDLALVPYAGPDEAEPSLRDLVLEIAMVPRESRLLAETAGCVDGWRPEAANTIPHWK